MAGEAEVLHISVLVGCNGNTTKFSEAAIGKEKTRLSTVSNEYSSSDVLSPSM